MTTAIALFEGLARSFGWWLRALVAWRDPLAPMSARRVGMLLVGMPLFLLLQLGHIVGLLLDELLFSGYRRTAVERPLFITGIPRSGTTFLHRTLAAETEAYTTLTTWEAVLAPSITQRRLIRALARLDGALGGRGAAGLNALTRRITGDLDAIHAVGMGSAEEDYLTLLPAGGCFVLLLAFPGAPGLRALGRADRALSAERRRRLLHLYRRLLQRHLYADGGERRLLSKNAAFGGWVDGLRETFPDARFILCLREPEAAFSSQISAVAGAGTLFGTAVDRAPFQTLFLELLAATLDHLAGTIPDWPRECAVIVDMDDLRAEPATTILSALARLGESPGTALTARLAALSAVGSGSAHHHAVEDLALPRERLTSRLRPAYRILMADPHRVGDTP
ncbi:MAG: sulfotransferase [Thiohalospira sp.]